MAKPVEAHCSDGCVAIGVCVLDHFVRGATEVVVTRDGRDGFYVRSDAPEEDD